MLGLFAKSAMNAYNDRDAEKRYLMKQDFLMIAEALSYKKLERLRHAGNKVGSDVLLDIIKLSIVDPYAILFFLESVFKSRPLE
ncbi:MAG: hypothetical protein QOJ84_1068 [Bradyrhizobium sp.]|jgi:hypothetical protein|nr:hypothetical protein [Bradyrhizobium sp.]